MDLMQLEITFWRFLKLARNALINLIIKYRLTTNETEVIRTNYGSVRGRKLKTIYDGEPYYSFRKIPFAKPPLGPLRFRAPQPTEPWEGVLDCTKYPSQPRHKDIILKMPVGSEDCLYLNVYVKKLDTKKPLPVLVWIYGGGFQIGSGTPELYDPDYFMRKDVVVVTLNYRLGVLGFLSLKDPALDVPGNAGLKDQLMALRWVKENIAHFNGDPNNITLFGESAGAASAHLMMLIEKANGLFHKAILQSGTALCPWMDSLQRDWAYRLACKLGYNGLNKERDIFEYLSKIDSKKFVRVQTQLNTKDEDREHIMFPFGPVVEPYDSENCITTKPFKEMLKNAWSNNIPVIIGGTSFEGLLFYQKTQQLPFLVDELGDCESVVPHEVRRNCDAVELREMGFKIKRAHFGDEQPSFKASFLPFLDLMSIKHFWHGTHRTVLSRRAYAANTPTYLYRFDFYSSDFNQLRLLLCGQNVRGVAHGDELSYLFYNRGSFKKSKSSAEYKTIERMIDIWTTFAATSDPNCPLIQPCVWSAIQGDDLKCLNINENSEFIDLPEREKLHVWDSLYTQDVLY